MISSKIINTDEIVGAEKEIQAADELYGTITCDCETAVACA